MTATVVGDAAEGRPPQVLGAILAGGSSSRMGTDKALVEIDGKPMALHVADAMRAGGCQEVVLVGADEATARALEMNTVPDRWPGDGPLGGLASALGASPPAGLVVVAACDQPAVTGTLVQALVDAVLTDHRAIAATPRTPSGHRHPFPTAWRAAARPGIEVLLRAGRRRADAGLYAVGVVAVPVEPAVIQDLDTPADVARWVDRDRSGDPGLPERDLPGS